MALTFPQVAQAQGFAIIDDATGGDCSSIGTWDPATKTCTLTADVSGSIRIESDAVTLDCAGHALSGSGAGIGIGLTDRTGVTVTNCVVTNLDTGIALANSDVNTLTGNTASGNVVDGFALSGSDSNILMGNAATGNGRNGFFLVFSILNTLTENLASANSEGFWVGSSSPNTHSTHNTLTGNVATGNANNGFLVSSNWNSLSGNTADENSGIGFAILAAGSGLTENVATGNDDIGFYSAAPNTLTDNVAAGNAHDGFRLGSANGLAGNVATGNGGDGFAAHQNANANVLSANIAVGNFGTGFAFIGSTHNTLTENVAKGNDGDGFALKRSQYVSPCCNTLAGNVATGNAGVGFVLVVSSDNTLTMNTATGNALAGIATFPPSVGNTIVGNEALDNGFVPSPISFDLFDNTIGGGTAGTANGYDSNRCRTSSPPGLCLPPENVPPVVAITGPPAGSVYAAGTMITFTGSFTDDPGDTHTATWTFDGTPFPGTVTESEGSGTVTDTYEFTAAGVYRVTLTATDDQGASGTADTVEGIDAFVVVYDPNGPFVTGGGWINSPPGAYVPSPMLMGKATFGFVAKYQQGASVPTGQTEFQFKVADLNFHSTSYDWLVCGGPKCKFKGEGTINGVGTYGFMLTAIDGDLPGGGGEDKIRMKIWDLPTGMIVYDNQMSDDDFADPTTVLGGGSIVIHKK